MERIIIDIHGMSCQGCARSITAALEALPGVEQVDVSLDAGQASIACNPDLVSRAALKNAVEEAGFSAN